MSNRPTAPTGRRRRIDGASASNHNHRSPRSLVDSGTGNMGNNSNGHISSSHLGNHPNSNHLPPSDDDDPATIPARSSLLQPRLAVVLGVSRRWHPFLFLCRLLSIAPALWWGFPSMVRLLALLSLKYGPRLAGVGGGRGGVGGGGGYTRDGSSIAAAASALPGGFVPSASFDWTSSEAKLRLKEGWITVIWCFTSGWVSYFLTDSLMSRALLYYTPLATIFRLSVINLINGLFTSYVLKLFGAPEDLRFSWAAWIVIAMMYTLVYYVTQRGINIRKETSMSMSVVSVASFVSMVFLLWHVHVDRATEYPDIPLVHNIKFAFQRAEELALKIMEYGNVTAGEL